MYAELFTLCPRRVSQLKCAQQVGRGIPLTVSRLVSIECGPIGASWGMQWYLSLSTLHITLPVQPCMVTCLLVVISENCVSIFANLQSFMKFMKFTSC